MMNLGDLLLVSMEMNKDSIAGAVKAYPSANTLQDMREERLRKALSGKGNNGSKSSDTKDGDSGTDGSENGDGKELASPSGAEDASIGLDDALGSGAEESGEPEESAGSADTADKETKEPLPEENKDEGSGTFDAHMLNEMFGSGGFGD